jgi:hypothetical protein
MLLILNMNRKRPIRISRQVLRIAAVANRRLRTGPVIYLLVIFLGGEIPALLHAQDNALRPVSGIVLTADTGKPLINALVRVSSPAIDMRFGRGPGQGVYETRTDTNGRFTLTVPPNPRISLNAVARGYAEAAGTYLRGNGDYHDLPFPGDGQQEFTIKLEPSLPVAGIVTDESGRPLSSIEMEATVWGAGYMAYVTVGLTDADGRFEVFGFPPTPREPGERGQLTFRNPLRLTQIINDVYPMNEAQRTNLHVSLSAGHGVKGVLTSTVGQPLPETVVEAIPADEQAAQRTAVTDAEGQFVFRGLPDGAVVLRAHSSNFDQQARMTNVIVGKDVEVNLRLEPVVLKNPPNPVNLFGMKLADVTPELQAVYDLDDPTGVLILDPGTAHLRLGIGALSTGLRFWVVGEKPVNNLREMVAELLRIDAIAPPGEPNEGCHGSVRVVYAQRSRLGTNTQRLALNEADRAELKSFLLKAPR